MISYNLDMRYFHKPDEDSSEEWYWMLFLDGRFEAIVVRNGDARLYESSQHVTLDVSNFSTEIEITEAEYLAAKLRYL